MMHYCDAIKYADYSLWKVTIRLCSDATYSNFDENIITYSELTSDTTVDDVIVHVL